MSSVDKSVKLVCLNIYVLYILLWTKYWLMRFESLLVFILFIKKLWTKTPQV